MKIFKPLVSIVLISILCFTANAQKSNIHGRITGLENTSNLVVHKLSKLNSTSIVDTIKIKNNGQYSLSVECPEPTLFFITLLGIDDSPVIHAMILPNEKVEIDMEYHSELKYLAITSTKGSKNLAVYKSFNNILHKPLAELISIDNEYMQPATSAERKKELTNRFQQLQIEQNQQIKQLLEQNTDALISAFLVTYFDNDFCNHVKLYETIRNSLIKEYPNNFFVTNINERVSNHVGIGAIAPEISLSNPDGKICKLSDLRGKVVLIDFWASWCGPCRAENPNVVRLYKKYNEKGFDIFSISLDKNKEQWLAAIAKDGLIWPNHVSELKGWTSTPGKRYGVTAIPFTLLIDQEGRIIGQNLRGKELENKLKEIFGF